MYVAYTAVDGASRATTWTGKETRTPIIESYPRSPGARREWKKYAGGSSVACRSPATFSATNFAKAPRRRASTRSNGNNVARGALSVRFVAGDDDDES